MWLFEMSSKVSDSKASVDSSDVTLFASWLIPLHESKALPDALNICSLESACRPSSDVSPLLSMPISSAANVGTCDYTRAT